MTCSAKTHERPATFFYDGWNLVEERVAYTNGATETIEYFWGKDLSGSLQGAGGVGGLRYVKRNGAIYIPCYDANGNITDYIDASGAVVASYAYDAFGGAISQSGALADAFAHRFSTKYFDAETGLYYYGYRFYSPDLMRWLSRDPIEESGGLNLYAFCLNNPLNGVDFLGREKLTLRYEMASDSSAGNERRRPKGTKHITTAAGVIADMRKAVGKYDSKGSGNCNCVESLYIGGHGAPGIFWLGDISLDHDSYNRGKRYTENHDVGKYEEYLRKTAKYDYVFFKALSEYLCKDAYVEIVACSAGKGDEGAALKADLQEVLGTKNVKLYECNVFYWGGDIISLPGWSGKRSHEN